MNKNDFLENKNSLHIIFRYSDKVRNIDTIKEHKEILDKYGFVWWGKFGTGISINSINKMMDQINNNQPTYLYLSKGCKILYFSQIVEVLGFGGYKKTRPKDTSAVPLYYRDEFCSSWFKLKNIKKFPEANTGKLVSFSNTSKKPNLTGRQGIIYVTQKN